MDNSVVIAWERGVEGNGGVYSGKHTMQCTDECGRIVHLKTV